MQFLITQGLQMLTSIMLGWRFYFCVTKIFSNFLTFRWRGLYSGICQSDFYDWVFLPIQILWCRESIGLELTLILLSARTHSHIIRNVETCQASSNPSPSSLFSIVQIWPCRGQEEGVWTGDWIATPKTNILSFLSWKISHCCECNYYNTKIWTFIQRKICDD